MIQVGAPTETALKERKARIEDAMHATRAAVEEGIVPGGGVALIRAIPAVLKTKLEGDEAVGAKIVAKALEAPTRKIAENAGAEGSVVVGRVREMKEKEGFNAVTGEYVDMVAAGIIDPTKVTRSALENAASIASMMLTTEAVVTEKPEKTPPAPAGPPGGMM